MNINNNNNNDNNNNNNNNNNNSNNNDCLSTKEKDMKKLTLSSAFHPPLPKKV